VKDLEDLTKAVDFLSIHTYPMHDTHYNPVFWGISPDEKVLPKTEKIEKAMDRALHYSISQRDSVANYLQSIGVEKPIHIGETGWASSSNGFYGPEGSKATDEYKEGLYYQKMREWTNREHISCFYFEAFDEPWKDAGNPGGSENFFGLFTVDGKAKYAVWDMVDKGLFSDLKRGSHTIKKTHNGQIQELLSEVNIPPIKDNFSSK